MAETISKQIIPIHWQLKKLGEVCKLKNGYAFKSDKYEVVGVPIIRISDINGGIVSCEKAIKVKANAEYKKYLVEKNDILIAMSGATTGKFGIYKSNEKAYQNQRVGKFKILDESILDNQFLFHQINSLKRQIEKDAYGGAQPNISSNRIEQMTVAIPPLPEQQLIVSKIEELLSDLENGKQQLQLAQQQLKIYRQSLLKWAFEGKLTNKNVKDGELPEGWKWMKVSDFREKESNSICAGPFGTIFKAKDFRSSGIPIIFLRHVKAGSYNMRKPGFMDKDIWEKLFKSYSVFGGELLITKLGEPPGECSIYPNGIGPAMVTPDVIKMNVNETIAVPKFLMYYFNSENSRKALQDIAFGSTRLRITIPIFKNLPVPFCDKKEQQLIVDELESKLTVCDKIEETISQSLLQAESLRQSILKKAFEGKLIDTSFQMEKIL